MPFGKNNNNVMYSKNSLKRLFIFLFRSDCWQFESMDDIHHAQYWERVLPLLQKKQKLNFTTNVTPVDEYMFKVINKNMNSVFWMFSIMNAVQILHHNKH